MRLRNAALSAHQILKSSSTSFSSSFKSSLSSRSGDVAVALHFQQHLSCLYASDIIDYFSNLFCSVKDFKLNIYLKVVLTFLPQIHDSAASGGSPLPALPAHTSTVTFIPIYSLPRRLPHSSRVSFSRSNESRQRPNTDGVLLPPLRPQVSRGNKKLSVVWVF